MRCWRAGVPIDKGNAREVYDKMKKEALTYVGDEEKGEVGEAFKRGFDRAFPGTIGALGETLGQ